MRSRYSSAFVLAIAIAATPLYAADEAAVAEAKKLMEHYEQVIVPLERAVNLCWWDANTTGSDEAFEAKQAAQNAYDAALADRERFETLKRLDAAELGDALLARQIHLLYLLHLEKQIPAELQRQLVAKSNAIEKAFNIYRATVDGVALSDSDVRKVLLESKDPEYRRRVWLASKAVGTIVEEQFLELVAARNEAARELGFDNFHTMMLTLNEQEPEQIDRIFDGLDELTRGPYEKIKSQIDQELATGYSITPAELYPWHYQDPFFQEPPRVTDVDMDAPLADADIPAICRKFYAGIGLPIDDVLAASDLYEKPGKSPHAFCTDIDRRGDVRVLANIVPNDYWMSTMLHELGHAVYSSQNIPAELPYIVRTDAHILATEGMAMMFERMCDSSRWLEAMGVSVEDGEAYDRSAETMRRYKLLIFSRWCQVMYRFEKSMYADPTQDLNRLWWDLVEEYQGVRRPTDRSAPDFASKIHVISAPVYYHNYLLGQLFASQLHETITREVLGGGEPATAVYWDRPEVGQFLQKRVFDLGRTRHWSEMVELATGRPLGSEAFAAEFAE